MEFVSFSLDKNISHAMSSVPTIMVAWGTVMTLMSLGEYLRGSPHVRLDFYPLLLAYFSE